MPSWWAKVKGVTPPEEGIENKERLLPASGAELIVSTTATRRVTTTTYDSVQVDKVSKQQREGTASSSWPFPARRGEKETRGVP